MYQLPDIITALPHPREPKLRDRPQLIGDIPQPDFDSRIPPYALGDPKDVVIADQTVEVERNARRSMSVHGDVTERREIDSSRRHVQHRQTERFQHREKRGDSIQVWPRLGQLLRF